MSKESFIRVLGLLNILGGAGLLAWWFLMPVLLPVSEAAENFEVMVLHPNWIPVNLVGLLAMLLLTLGFPGLYLSSHEETGKWGLTGMIMAMTGLILYTSIQYYETLLWPAAASINPDLVGIQGELVWGDLRVVSGLITSGIFLGLGYLIWGLVSFRKNTLPGWLAFCLIAGAVIFGNGVLFPIRTLGAFLYCPATIIFGIRLRKNYFKPETS